MTIGKAGEGPAKRHFEAICNIGERPVGSAGAKRAEAYVESVLKRAGFETRRDGYPCTDWRLADCSVESRGAGAAGVEGPDGLPSSGPRRLSAIANPFSPSAGVSGRCRFAGSLDELAARGIAGEIVVLGPELCGFPIMPKAFDFYNPEEHRRLVALLEAGKPAAVVAISPHDRGIWPVFADPDLPLSSVTIPARESRFAAEGAELRIELSASLSMSSGATVSGLLRLAPDGSRRRLLCAHLDTKHYTPGALDNGAGVAAVLAAAEIAAGRGAPSRAALRGTADLEVVFFMGEECNAYGEKAWLAARGGTVADISLAVNCDGVGGRSAPTALSFFNFPEEAKASVMAAAGGIGRFSEAGPWYESDHYLFWPSGIPTIAATSGDPHRFDRLIHGPDDRPELVDPSLLDEVAELCAALCLGR